MSRVVRVATSGRRFRTYVGKLPGGRKLPGGPRPIEQVVAFCVALAAAGVVSIYSGYNTLMVFTVGVSVGVAAVCAMSFIRYDGAPVIGTSRRLLRLAVNRKPIIVGVAELDRQRCANPDMG